MAARFDKYDGMVGGFRAQLNAAITATSGSGSTSQIGVPLGVGINTSGKLVIGAGNTGVVGVICVDSAKAAGDYVDVMTSGEIVDLDSDDFDPGVVYYAHATTGVLSDTDTGTKVGHTVVDKSLTGGADRLRLVVRAQTLPILPDPA